MIDDQLGSHMERCDRCGRFSANWMHVRAHVGRSGEDVSYTLCARDFAAACLRWLGPWALVVFVSGVVLGVFAGRL